MASTKQTTQSWKQLNTTAAHKSYWRREKPHSPPSTCSINPCYQKSPSPRANCTPASWPSSQPKTAKLVTSSSDPAQCGHHTLGRVYPVDNMSVIYCTYLLRHDTVLYHAEITVPTRGLIWIFLEYVSVVVNARSLAFWYCGVFTTCSATAVRAILTYFNGIYPVVTLILVVEKKALFSLWATALFLPTLGADEMMS